MNSQVMLLDRFQIHQLPCTRACIVANVQSVKVSVPTDIGLPEPLNHEQQFHGMVNKNTGKKPRQTFLFNSIEWVRIPG